MDCSVAQFTMQVSCGRTSMRLEPMMAPVSSMLSKSSGVFKQRERQRAALQPAHHDRSRRVGGSRDCSAARSASSIGSPERHLNNRLQAPPDQ